MKTVIAFFRLIRIVNLLIIALCIGLFYYLIMVPVHNNTLMTTFVPLNHLDFVVFTLSVMFVAAGGNIINDYFDFELDKEFKPNRPLAQGAFSLNTAIYLHGFFIFAGIAMGFYLGWGYGKFSFGYLYVVAALLLYVYSAYLKK
ncbi:MAG TPA: UbiA family prenyltransferase, partial [Chitinophagales bacterium]|nr:UbiA family prenyltransferase [Chitinophagales bacterium]